jgi:UDP-N-acetylglucosamine/UDP-N-acetylgalactosamine diphosphorylase
MPTELQLALSRMGQQQLLSTWEQLSEGQRKLLALQFSQLTPELLHEQRSVAPTPPVSLEPWTDVAIATQQLQGQQALRDGKVACLVLAGGQASRMRCQGPKGLLQVSPVRNKSLFQLIAEATLAASHSADRPLSLAIMTSPAHQAQVSEYFEVNGHFGLAQEQLSLFAQQELPLLDLEKNWFLESPERLATGPDGNGGALHCLYHSGIWSRWKAAGVELVRILLVDNPLADPFDTGLIGCHLANSWQVSLEALERQEPQERVGLLVESNGRPAVAEYSEAPEALKEARDSMGRLVVRWANLSQFCMTLSFIEQVALGPPLPLHLALKSAKTLSGWPQQPNCWKCERFIFDALSRAHSIGVVASPRSRYAPLKELDALERVREAMSRRDRRRLEQLSGVEQPEGVYELNAQFHYPTATLRRSWSGKAAVPGYVDL